MCLATFETSIQIIWNALLHNVYYHLVCYLSSETSSWLKLPCFAVVIRPLSILLMKPNVHFSLSYRRSTTVSLEIRNVSTENLRISQATRKPFRMIFSSTDLHTLKVLSVLGELSCKKRDPSIQTTRSSSPWRSKYGIVILETCLWISPMTSNIWAVHFAFIPSCHTSGSLAYFSTYKVKLRFIRKLTVWDTDHPTWS